MFYLPFFLCCLCVPLTISYATFTNVITTKIAATTNKNVNNATKQKAKTAISTIAATTAPALSSAMPSLSFNLPHKVVLSASTSINSPSRPTTSILRFFFDFFKHIPPFYSKYQSKAVSSSPLT